MLVGWRSSLVETKRKGKEERSRFHPSSIPVVSWSGECACSAVLGPPSHPKVAEALHGLALDLLLKHMSCVTPAQAVRNQPSRRSRQSRESRESRELRPTTESSKHASNIELGTSATLLVTSALLVVTRSY